MKGALPGLVRWARRTVKRGFCPALAALISREQKTFVPITSKNSASGTFHHSIDLK